jgi:hypothetical protein
VEPLHRLFLQSCFSSPDIAQAALQELANSEADQAALRLLPFLHRRWGGSESSQLLQKAHLTYLSTWAQNHERMSNLRALLAALGAAAVPAMLLKGAALTLKHYRDYGLRHMGDFDILIPERHLDSALRLLLSEGWIPEQECSRESILRQSRVRHAWQFSRGGQHCDLHWRPLASCNAPQLADMFWSGAQTVHLDGLTVQVPGPTDLYFHVCVHAMHWEWTQNLYWVGDALAVIKDSPLDWDRITALAKASQLTVRLAEALKVLDEFVAPAPALPPAPPWEYREFRLLQKPCPLNLPDRVAWHWYRFKRLRRFDAGLGFAEYLRTFLDAPTWPELARATLKLKIHKREMPVRYSEDLNRQ